MSAAPGFNMDVHPFPVSAGDVILRDQPWIYSLFPENIPDYCYRCFVPFDRGQNGQVDGQNGNSQYSNGAGLGMPVGCSGCGVPKYCSTQCQISDKNCPFRHGHECKMLKALRAKGVQPSTDLLLLLKAMIRLKVEKSGDFPVDKQVCSPPTDRTWARLMSHSEDILADEPRLKYVQQLRQSLALLLWEADVPDIHSLVQMYGRIKVNSFDIRDPYLRRLGEGVYLGASQVDHSCQRNAVFYFEGTSIVIKAMSHVSSLADVRISYTEIFSTTSLRQQDLQEWFYFQCTCHLCTDPQKEAEVQCIKCCTPSCPRPVPLDQRADDVVCETCLAFVENNWPKGLENPPSDGTGTLTEANSWSDFNWHDDINHRLRLVRRLLPLDVKQHAKIERLMRKQPTLQVLEEIEQRCRRMLETAELLLHPDNFTRCLTHDTLAKVLLMMGPDKLTEAVTNFDLSLPGLRNAVAECDPRLGLQLLTCALLHGKAGNSAEAASRAKEAVDIFTLVDGAKRPLCSLASRVYKYSSGSPDGVQFSDEMATGLKVLTDVLCRSLFPTVRADNT